MTTTITTENASFEYEVVIDTIRATIPSAESSVFPFGNQFFKHSKAPKLVTR